MKIVIEDKLDWKKEDGGAALVGYPMYEILKMNFWAFQNKQESDIILL